MISLFDNNYFILFFDTITASLAFAVNTGMMYKLMSIFGEYNKFWMIIIAVVGSGIGSSINYLMGMILRSVKQKIKSFKDSEDLLKFEKYINTRLSWVVFFAFITFFGPTVTIASGFLRIKFKKFLVILVLGRVSYYLFPIL